MVSALRCEVSEYEIQIWAKAYENLLQSLTSNRARGLNKKTSAALRGNGMDAVRGLVHGGKTFRIAQRLLQKYPALEGPMIEVGAGWGPFAFAAADYAFTPITLMEKSKRMLEYAKAAFEKAGHKEPKCLIQDIGDHINYRNYSCFAAPFVLNELLHGVADHEKQEAALRWVRLWMRRLRPGGRLYLIEPGTVEASEVIQKLRNKLKDEYQIVGPCTHSMDCPMEERPKDWCHFTLRISSGPLAR